LSFDVACGPVNLHRVAVIAALQQEGIAPKPSDLFFVRGPVRDVPPKDGPKRRMGPNMLIELRHDTVDLCLGNGNAGWHCHTTTIQTTIRLATR